MIDKRLRQISGAALLLIGLTSALAFNKFVQWFFFISPDGDIGAATLLELRIVLASLGAIGFYLLFQGSIHRLLESTHDRIQKMPARNFLIVALSIGLFLRLIVVVCMEIPLYIDYQGYDELAWNWVQQGGYYNGDQLTGYYPVGYPFFLSRLYYLFGHAPLAGAIANIFLSLSIGWLSYRIAERIFDNKIARFCLIFMMLFPSQILFVNLLASELLFTPLFLLSLLLFLTDNTDRSRNWWLPFVGGVLLGLAVLTRALAQVYWLVLIPLFYLQSRSLKITATRTALMFAGLALVVTPWIVRNHQAVGRARVSTNGGINLMIGNNPGSGMGWIEVDTVEFNTHDASREAYIDSVGAKRGWAFIRQDPIAFLKRGVLKTGYFYSGDLTGIHYQMKQAAENSRHDWSVLLALLSQSYYLLVLFFGGAGLFVYVRRRQWSPGGYLLWGTILFWTAVHFVFFGHARFHFPIMPMVAIFASLYLVHVVEGQDRQNPE